ncbi:MAG: hypothetical protein IKJ31_02975 [Bacteroidaceae bacterium]|nr:hypothetical protein [Bacteroidaceae bacterium]
MLLVSMTIGNATAQNLSYNVELSGNAGSGDYAPFWHISNRQGIMSQENSSGYIRAGLAGDYKFGNSDWSINCGIDFISTKNHTSTVYIQQAFADVSWKMFTLSMGQKERWAPLKNHRLSTGGLTESGNARPIPQIRLEVPEYWDIFRTNGWFTLRGHLAYGWFSDGNWQEDFVVKGNSYTTGVRYHSKALFGKFGNEKKFPLTFEGGVHMVAQFGGTSYNHLNKEGETMTNPTRFKDYLLILIPGRGDSQYGGADQANVAGNHLGSYYLAFKWHEKDWLLSTYYEHTFEDHSQMFWEYGIWTEQLVGIELTLKNCKWVKGVALEYFNLKNHGGPIYHDTTSDIPDQISCGDSNYTHGFYNGWFNYGMIIGTPLVTSPIYNTDGVLTCYNNRLEAFHIGIEGEPLSYLGYRVLLTHSNNWGTYKNPFTEIKNNTSGMLEITYKPHFLKGFDVKASFAFDKGELYGDNYAGMLTISKRGIIDIFKK